MQFGIVALSYASPQENNRKNRHPIAFAYRLRL